MTKPTQYAWAKAIVDFIKRETMFSEIDLSDRFTLMQISNGLRLANEWVISIDEENSTDESFKT